jgi:ribose-phosphate pyrophosphokinase
MIALNLVNPEKSQIKYKVSKFPDGQQTVDLTDWFALNRDEPVKISSRLNTFQDLELIICAVAAIRNIKPNKQIALHVPYFMGARSDRKFGDGGVNYLKQVICPIINSLKLDSIIVLDPHSDVLEACLNNYDKLDNHIIVKHALSKIDNRNGAPERICLVSPDAGAYKKIFDVAKKFGIDNVVTANKVRDMKTGKILSTEIPNLPSSTGDPNSVNDGMKYVIVDDICDGGRTFIELAKAIKKERISAKIYLVVTHGIFSAGLKELNQHFEGIFTTNSYSDMNDPEFSLRNDNEMHQLKQLNIF